MTRRRPVIRIIENTTMHGRPILVMIALFMSAAVLRAQPMRSVPSLAYPTIASAAMTAPPGTTILIAPGVYSETIEDFGAGLVFQGDSQGGTIIDGGLLRRAFVLTAQSTLNDLSFRRCVGANGAPCGSATFLVKMRRCKFRYCYDYLTPMPLFKFVSGFDIVECRFENCEALGSVLECGNPAQTGTSLSQLSRCVIRANLGDHLIYTKSSPAFILGVPPATITIDNSLILDNESAQELIRMEGGRGVAITFNTIVHNYSVLTLNSLLSGGAQANINSCILRQNLSVPGAESLNCNISFSNVSGVGISPTNFDIEPTFFNAQVGNYRLHPFSVSIDTGRAPVAITNVRDLDGFPRNIGVATDQGCYEYGGPDPGPAFDGTDTTNLPQIGEAPILRLNGSDGGRNHVVPVMAGQMLEISVQQPDIQIPANFIIWAQFGFPDAFNPTPIPQTSAGLIVVTPQYLDPMNPALFTLADTFTPSNGVVPATLAPWVVQSVAMPLFAPVAFQGIIENGTGGWAITNCVVLFIGPS